MSSSWRKEGNGLLTEDRKPKAGSETIVEIIQGRYDIRTC